MAAPRFIKEKPEIALPIPADNTERENLGDLFFAITDSCRDKPFFLAPHAIRLTILQSIDKKYPLTKAALVQTAEYIITEHGINDWKTQDPTEIAEFKKLMTDVFDETVKRLAQQANSKTPAQNYLF